MKYRIKYDKKMLKELSKFDKPVQIMIKCWIEKNLKNTDNPRLHGKGLVGNRSGYWRYRIGDYRLITKINDDELIIIAIEVGHRKDIYR